MSRTRFTVSPIAAFAAMALVFPLTACESSTTDRNPGLPNIVEAAQSGGAFSTLLTALDGAGLTQTVAEVGPFTIFAPTDAAFAQIPAADLQALLANPQALAAILTYHVVAGELLSGAVVAENTLSTVNGASVRVSVNGGAVKINDANIVAVDIQATNGVIHVIDAVIFPPQD